jgi:pyruvate/2-oxoglutarate dehydrogenase complex dihydrolipoamide dehydrogenase (E3) component
VATEDHDISDLLEKELKKKKIRLVTGIKVEKVDVRRRCAYLPL